MAYNSKVVQKVLVDFEGKEKAAISAAQKRKDELYKKLPELRDIDGKLALAHKQIVDCMLEPGDDIGAKLEAIKNNNKALQQRRRLMLATHEYAENYTEPVYECRNCGDAGYKNGEICVCLKRALALESAKESGFGDIIKAQNFKNFSLGWYSRDSGDYERMETVLESCRNYAKKFRQPGYAVKHMIFIGGTGLGKTHLSSAIAGEIIKKGYDVYYNSAQRILYSFEQERFAHRSEFDRDIIERYMSCDLLIIDDLGTEYSGSMSASSLYALINMRLAEGRNMIISTNLDYNEIHKRYDARVVSRIFGEFSPMLFAGEDIRLQK